MKRTFAFLFAALFSLSVFVSCGSAPAETATAPETATAETETAAPQKDTKQQEVQDPAEDGVLRILLIGNSFCYYYPDEIYGMLKSAGIRAEVANVYYSGCTLSQHWDWYDMETNYRFILYSDSGKRLEDDKNMRYCLDARNWDIISFQQHFSPGRTETYEIAFESCEAPLRALLKAVARKKPMARLVWNETWAYQVGYELPEKKMAVKSTEDQTHQYQVIHDVSKKLCEEFSLPCVPLGEAWQLARAKSEVGDRLCNKKNGTTDSYHDGDAGGGQFLNACVWYEFLTGQSCLENNFKPDSYSLSAELTAALKEAAHQAMEEWER